MNRFCDTCQKVTHHFAGVARRRADGRIFSQEWHCESCGSKDIEMPNI